MLSRNDFATSVLGRLGQLGAKVLPRYDELSYCFFVDVSAAATGKKGYLRLEQWYDRYQEALLDGRGEQAIDDLARYWMQLLTHAESQYALAQANAPAAAAATTPAPAPVAAPAAAPPPVVTSPASAPLAPLTLLSPVPPAAAASLAPPASMSPAAPQWQPSMPTSKIPLAPPRRPPLWPILLAAAIPVGLLFVLCLGVGVIIFS
ncbi:MAG TPA: hypothetical protein VMP01_00430, partial [Pirellulaceae bacterium]|nr:hypothetical protein [Pirellulaceae bacterium]